ncbi:MAG: flagellar biosynthesis anti-sigma factor FlgM [Planctomycetota bacterium]|nr:MAG: flagellar biosynthesis anti-sigma factor FlgM [Planctomycetota bacterium]
MDITGPTGVGGAGPVDPRKRVGRAESTEKPAEVSAPRSADKVEISSGTEAPDKAAYVERLREMLNDVPDVRAERIAEIRKEIEAGTFETDDRINGAIERLLDELA